MKKLFGGKGKNAAASGPLCGHLVQVGAWQVRCEALLGSGGYADIYRVTDISSDKTYALKHLRLNTDQDIIAEVQHEARVQAKLKHHPNILRVHAVSFAGVPKGGETDGFFLLDYCPGTLLGALQQRNFQLEDRAVFHIFHCVCQALAHMHSQKPPMAHRDLKAENVLMLPDGTWVLADFGSTTTRAQVYETTEAMAAEEEVIRKHTTPAYRAPELWDLYQRQLIDTKVDIWALGVLLFVLCFGRLPFTGDSKLQILNGKYDLPPTRPPQLRALIRNLLVLNPAERPDIHQTLQQLNEAAVAVLGQPLTAPAARSSTQAAATADQQGQRQQQQQQQAGRLPEPSSAASSSTGSFWNTADAVGIQRHSSPEAAAPASGSTAPSTHHHQQQLPHDWARFNASAGAAALPARVHAQQTMPHSNTQSGEAAGVAAAVATASSSSKSAPSGGVPVVQSSSASASAASAPPVAPSNGYYPSIPGHGFGRNSTNSADQPQSNPDLQQLADMPPACAQAAVAAGAVVGKQTAPAPPSPHQQQQQPQRRHSAEMTDPPLLLERRSQPYSSGSAGSSVHGTPCTAVAAVATSPTDSPSASQADAGGSNTGDSGGRLVGDHSRSTSRQGVGSGNTVAASHGSSARSHLPTVSAAGASALAAGHNSSSSRSSSSSSRAGRGNMAGDGPVMAMSSAAAQLAATAAAVRGHASSGVDACSLPELRAAVFGELDMLRAQVQSLSDQNQAFVFRIKQLEDYAQRQEVAVAKLQEQVVAMQQQQQSSRSAQVAHGVFGSSVSGLHAAPTLRESSGTASGAGQVAGGRFWSSLSSNNAL